MGSEQVAAGNNYNGNINGIQGQYKFGQSSNAPSNFDLPTVYDYHSAVLLPEKRVVEEVSFSVIFSV